jgi:serine protease
MGGATMKISLLFDHLALRRSSRTPGRRTRQSRRRLIKPTQAQWVAEVLEERVLLSVDPIIDFGEVTIDTKSYEDSTVLVQLNDGATADDIAGILQNVEIVALSNGSPGFLEVTLRPEITVDAAMAAYSESQFVAYVEPNYRLQLAAVGDPVTPDDPMYSSLWGLNNTGQSGGTLDADIDAAEAWAITTGSSSTIVAVIDTGVDYTHPDLAANMWVNSGEIAGNGIDDDANGYIDDIYGYDFVNNDGDPFDDHSHGTHVAGTIAGVGDNGIGVTGVAWNARIMGLKFLSASGSGYISNAVRALDYAVANGAKISNNSWGGGGYSQSMADAITRAQAAGHVFVAAAGNNGTDNDVGPHYPSNYTHDNVISVAATDRYDAMASFSNYGATTVDIAAPGVSTLSTTPNNSYAYYSGTSMATPHVSGVVALVMSQHPDWTYQQIVDQVLNTSDALSSLEGKMVTAGRLNAARAVGAVVADSIGAEVISASPDGLVTGSASTIRLRFSEPIDPTSFTTDDIVSFNGPNGAISITSVVEVSGSNGREFDLSFASQSALGAYTLVVGPQILDLAGNAMDQDQDRTNGETLDDRFTTSFTISDLKIFSSTTTTAINDLQTTQSTITVNEDFLIADLNVQLDVTHTWDSDLLIILTGPDGTAVTLSNSRGGSGNDFSGTIFDDEAGSSISLGQAPFSGSFRPDGNLAEFDGLLSRGTWTLSIYDDAYWDQGTLNSWSMMFDTFEVTADLNGIWGASGDASAIAQSGANLSFTNEHGNTSGGRFTAADRVFASSWNLFGTHEGTTVRWDNGSEWWQTPSTYEDVAGNWTFNNAGTSIAQDGAFVTFFNENGQSSAGQFIASNRVLAAEWGLQGTVSGSDINWDNGTTWQEAVSNVPDVSGDWTYNGQGTRIQQSGSTLTFFNENGAQSAGHFISSSRVRASGWNLEGTINGDRIDWDNGTAWQQGAQSMPNLAGDWTYNNQTTRIEQSGSDLTFFNENGASSAGQFLSNTRVRANGWNLEGTINGDRIDWDNGTAWQQGAQSMPNLAGDWTYNGRTTQVTQSGSDLTFFNENGASSAGQFLSNTRVRATGWNLEGTVSNNRIDWDNGSAWNSGVSGPSHGASSNTRSLTAATANHVMDVSLSRGVTPVVELTTNTASHSVAPQIDADATVSTATVSTARRASAPSGVMSQATTGNSLADSTTSNRLEANIVDTSEQIDTPSDNAVGDSTTNDVLESVFAAVDAELLDQLLFGNAEDEQSTTQNRLDAPLM